jgi:hypothetical protein
MKLLSKINILPTALLLAVNGSAWAQDAIYIDGTFSVSASTTDYVQFYADVTLAPTAQAYLQDGVENLIFYGQNFKASTGAQILGANAAWTTFVQGANASGTNSYLTFQQPNPNYGNLGQQTLDGGNGGNPANNGQNTFTGIKLDNVAGVRLTNSDTRVGSDIFFTNGHFYLGTNDAVLSTAATLTNYNINRYVVTDVSPQANGGHLVKENYTGAFEFPVGMSDLSTYQSKSSPNNDYTPATITPATANTIRVSVTDYTGDDPVFEAGNNGIDRTWNIYGNSNTVADISLTHNTVTNQSAWNIIENFVTRYGPDTPNTKGNNSSGTAWESNTLQHNTINSDAETQVRPYANLATSATSGLLSLGRETTTITAWYSKSSNTAMPLPVRLIYFTGNRNNNNDYLSWQTADETGITHYVLEYSANAADFSPVGTVSAKGTATSTTLTQDYTLPHYNVNGITYYYRLKMVEADGSYTNSPVVPLRGGAKDGNNITIIPNPAKGTATIAGLSGGETLRIYAATGQLVQTHKDMPAGSYTLQLSEMASGQYMVYIMQPNGALQTQKIVVQQ